MKSILRAAALVTTAFAQNEYLFTENCLYCKMMDTKAGFLYTYDFCADEGELETDARCIADYWDFISKNTKCIKDVKPGWQLDIFTDCEATEQAESCSDFAPTTEMYGTTV